MKFIIGGVSELMAIRKGSGSIFKTIKDQYLRTCKIETPAEPCCITW